MVRSKAIVTSTSWLFVATCVFLPNGLAAGPRIDQEDVDFFESKIRPLLIERCFSCHSSQAKTVHGGLLLDTSAAIQTGGDTGPLLDRENPDHSLLLEVIQYDGPIQMPPEGRLPEAEIAHLTNWVRRGIPLPTTVAQPTRTRRSIDFAEGRAFWSFLPLKQPPIPVVRNDLWPRTQLDSFVLSAMEREGLSPSPEADRPTLIRRLSFDLTGLPPTPSEVREFVADESVDAYRRLVERLLASPRHGEKWARMWLDLARYTDRTASWLYQTGQAHHYRDWITRALNEDLPYDEFVHRQLATDLMPETGLDDLPALGFISLSPTYWKELMLPCEIINAIVADEWEERVDAVSRTFLGLTVACARCHDHKFDPISSADYYALAGVFASCRQVERPMISEDEFEPVRLARKQVAELEAEVTRLKKLKPPPQDEIDTLLSKRR